MKLFPDLNEKEIEDIVTVRLAEARIPAEEIWAWLKTGMLVTDHNRAKWPKADMEEWEAAVAEYRARKPDIEERIAQARKRAARRDAS